MGLIRAIFRVSFAVLIFTVIGQIRIEGRSLESRYHASVNTPEFQNLYWRLLTPATWTLDRISDLVKSTDRPKAR